MANLTEVSSFVSGVYKIVASDFVTDTNFNAVTQALTNRTRWLKDQLIQATESVLGFVKIASQVQTDGGVHDDTAVTPKKLRNGYAQSLGDNGYIKLPTWMGGWMFQWTRSDINNTQGDYDVPFPVSFPTACFMPMVCTNRAPGASGNSDKYYEVGYWDANSCVVYLNTLPSSNSDGMVALVWAVGH